MHPEFGEMIPKRRKITAAEFRPFLVTPEVLLNPERSSENSRQVVCFNEYGKFKKMDNPGSFQLAIGPFLAVMQLLGLFPVSGVCNRNMTTLKFYLRSFPCIIFFLVTFTVGIMQVIEKITRGKNIQDSIGRIIFYGNALCGRGIFFWISKRWIKLLQEWKTMEDKLNSYNRNDRRLRFRINALAFVMIIMFIFEIVLKTVSNAVRHQMMNESVKIDFWVAYVGANFKNQALVSRDSVFADAAGIVDFIVRVATFLTSILTDTFIALISIGLNENYMRLNKIAASPIQKNGYPAHWFSLRQKYSLLRHLMKSINNCVSPLILLSFTYNISMICLIISFVTGYPKVDFTEKLFHYPGFLCFSGRTFLITLLAANINEKSKKTLEVLHNCPTSCFTHDAQRLQNQLTTDEVALTGMNFFSITRKFLLTVFSAIVTYAIIMKQMYKSG